LGQTERKSISDKSAFFGRISRNIRHGIPAIPMQELQSMARKIFSRYGACLEADGRHFEAFLK
jgi:hypothetical protein